MKFLIASFLIFVSFTASSSESYECDFFGPNYTLSIDDNQVITLKNNFKTYLCEKGRVNFPGTELELNVFNCTSKNEKKTFFYAILSENEIILSKDLGITKDISCLKK